MIKEGLRYVEPYDEIQRRYGWATGIKAREQDDRDVLCWMRAVAREIWDQRYSNSNTKQRVETARQRRRAHTDWVATEDRQAEHEEMLREWLRHEEHMQNGRERDGEEGGEEGLREGTRGECFEHDMGGP